MDNKTEVQLENNWLRLFSPVNGYVVCLKTFDIDGRRQTVAIDNFSISHITLLDYDLDDVELDLVEWENVWDKDILRFNRYDEGLKGMKEILSEEDYKDLEKLYDERFAF